LDNFVAGARPVFVTSTELDSHRRTCGGGFLANHD
jgi:hypothetical protein